MFTFTISIENGFMKAPTMIVEADKEDTAILIARKNSGLGRFPSWTFSAYSYQSKNPLRPKQNV